MSFGSFWGAVFFFLLFLAALTSSISMLEVPVATLIDSYCFKRKKATWIVSFIVILIGLPSALSYTSLQLELFGKPLLDLKDFAFGTVGIIVSGLVLSIIAGWFLDPGIIFKEIKGDRKMQKVFLIIIRFFIPLILFTNLIARVIKPD